MFDTFVRHQHLRHLNIDGLPSEERPYGNVLWHQLNDLESYVSCFGDALELFDACARNPKSPEFKFVHIASRDGAMTLYHYLRALQSIKRCIDACPTLRKKVDVGKIDDALRSLHAFFPDAKGVRDSVGHTSELMSSPARWDAHALIDGRVNEQISIGEKGFWMNDLIGRTFTTTTFGGQLVKYDVSGETLARLNELTNQVFSAFSSPSEGRERQATKPSTTR